MNLLSVSQAKVVAGFFASNLGDASPNTYGARCEFSGIECDNQFVVCGAGERCFAPGPGDDMFESVKIIGTKIYDGAMVSIRPQLECVNHSKCIDLFYLFLFLFYNSSITFMNFKNNYHFAI